MSRSLGYIRKFIIFKKDYSNMHMFNSVGHGKIEMKGLKGNVTINIENAEPDSFYNIAFVDKKKSEIIGKIYTEENGSGKAEIVCNLKDLESKGFPSEKINGILIFRDTNILLGGYIIKEDNSIEEFIENMPKKELQVKKIEAEKAEEKKKIEEVQEVQVEAAEVTYQEQELPPSEIDSEESGSEENDSEKHDFGEYIPEEYVEEEFPSDEPIGMVPAVESIPEEVLTPNTSNYQEGVSITNLASSTTYGYDNIEMTRKISQKKQTTDYILNILRYFPYIEPFKFELYGYNWWKINFEDGEDPRGFLPYFSLLIGGEKKNNIVNDHHITAMDLMKKYEHYIFGLYNVNDEVKFYVYGVPGTFNKDEHPHRGITGFNTWFEGNDMDGYWLLYIDPLNGKVIYPANPMIPTN